MNDKATELFAFLKRLRGKGILTGQQESGWGGYADSEMDYIYEVSGKLPAIRAMDFIDNTFDEVVLRSRQWHEKNGIVSICWHWGAPPDGLGYQSSLGEIDMAEAVKEGAALNQAVVRRMDEAAEALKQLRDAGIPVLWRPLHEFDGAWFWWGKGSAEEFIALWRLMHDRFTKVHQLDNLIWVLGYSHILKDGWYPGDEYVDIAGADAYREGTQENMYTWLRERVGEDMLLAYHECGPMPEPDELIADKVEWSWFATWHTIHIREQNTREKVNRIYNHPYCITLDKLPTH